MLPEEQEVAKAVHDAIIVKSQVAGALEHVGKPASKEEGGQHDTQAMSDDLLPLKSITQRIAILRGHKVLLDADLAQLYGVPTKRFNEQVKRNLARFPADFMCQVTEEEFDALRSRFATSNGHNAGHDLE